MDGRASIGYNVLEHMLLNENEKPTKLPLSLLEAITNNFSNEQEIGRGGFAVVYKGMLRIGEVAVKKLSETLDLHDQKYIREVHCLMKARHKNIVRFLGYCSETQGEMVDYEGKLVMADLRNRLLCFEFVPGGSLCDYITDAYSGLEWIVRYQIIKGICEGLHYLHENRIVHLDLKPSNILLDGKMVPKIADFGISRCFDEKQSKDITSKLIGSMGYLAPEYYNGHITMKLDIYSLGVIIVEVLTGAKGYFAIEKVLDKWRNRPGLPEGDTPLQQIRACAEIGMRCIDSNPENRPTMQYIMRKFDELKSAYGLVEASTATSVARMRGVTATGKFISVDPAQLRHSIWYSGTSSSVVPLADAFAAPIMVFDAQEAKIQLMHRLVACAEATEQHSFSFADVLVKVTVAAFQGAAAATRKVAIYFGEALNHRRLVYRSHPTPDSSSSLLDAACCADLLHAHFYKSCPYLKFAHLTANQAILEAFAGCRRVHVIDFDIKNWMQWPALLNALALRPEGPPVFTLTGVGVPQADEIRDVMMQAGFKLAHYASTLRIAFQNRSIVTSSLANLDPSLLLDSEETDDEHEVIAVNSVFELHRLLAVPGALEKFLGMVRAVRPKIVTVAEQDANHNTGSFLDRFRESLDYYSAMFEALEGAGSFESADDKAMSEVYLSRQICNVVACEGSERTERHETLGQWRNRLLRAGFEPHCLGTDVSEHASMLLSHFPGGDGYRVQEKNGCLTLGWQTRPLIATSAWRLADSDHGNS